MCGGVLFLEIFLHESSLEALPRLAHNGSGLNAVWFFALASLRFININNLRNMNISLENWLRNKLQENEEMHDYAVATETVRCWIDEYKQLSQPVVIKSLPLQDLIEFCERQEDFYDEEGYSEDAKKFHNAAYAFTKFWAEKTYGNVL